MKVNYDLKMEEILKEITESGKKKRLLIHSCCGPCSSSVLEYLKEFFQIDIYFYNPKEDFFEKIKGLENEKEGGQRCYSCYDIRIGETAKKAKEEGYDFFSTVLSISPMKNVNYINEIGEKYSKKYDIPFLFADFKKKNRYLRSVQISKELNMYRQEYCGCVFSKVEKEQRDREKAEKEKQEETKND